MPPSFTVDSMVAAPYLAQIFATAPIARKPQTINITNPNNPATRSSKFVAVDPRETVQPTKEFDIRMPEVNGDGAKFLASTKAGRPNTYTQRSVMNAWRMETGAPKRERSKTKKSAPIPTSITAPSSPAESDGSPPPLRSTQRRAAAVSGEKKRKRATVRHEIESAYVQDEAEAEAALESDDSMAPPMKKRKRARKAANPTAKNSSPRNGTACATGYRTTGLIRKKDAGIRVPKTLAEAGEADRMLWEWRHSGKSWADVTAKWTELTRKTPGKSTLSVRFIKLQENFAQAGGAADIMLLQYRTAAEQQMEGDLWQRVSDMIKTELNDDIPAELLRRRYNALKQNNFDVGAELTYNDNVPANSDMPDREPIGTDDDASSQYENKVPDQTPDDTPIDPALKTMVEPSELPPEDAQAAEELLLREADAKAAELNQQARKSLLVEYDSDIDGSTNGTHQ